MYEGLFHVALDGDQRYTQLLGDVVVLEAVDLRQQEGALDQWRQGIEHGVDFVQGFQHHEVRLGRRRFVGGHVRQRIQVGAFQCLALVPVDQDALGHAAQVRPWLVNHRDL